MAGERQTPGLGLIAFWNPLSSGWDTGMNANLLKLSALCQLRVLNIVTALPGEPVNGDIYIVTTGAQAGKIAVRDAGAWIYYAPSTGILAYNIATERFIVYADSEWSDLPILPVISAGNGGQFLAVKDDGTGFEVRQLPALNAAPLTIIEANASVVLDETYVSALLRIGTAGAATVTFPPNVFDIGDQIHIRATGAGQITCMAGAGVTINTPETRKLRKNGSTVTAICVAANVFDLMGDIEALP